MEPANSATQILYPFDISTYKSINKIIEHEMSECVSVALKYLDNPHVEALKLGKSDSQVTSNRSFTNWSCDEIMFFDDERIK